MAGYTRQSSAQIISGEVISASPLNAEYNQLLNAFDASTGHKHDGTTAEGPPIDRVADADQRNKVLIDSNNNELEFYVEQGGASEKQVSIKHEIIEPTTDNNVDLGGANNAFRNVHVKGTTNLVNTVITGTLNLAGISSSSGTLELGSAVNIDGGSIDGTPIGSNSASTISGTTITATTKFVGPIEGAVTGNVTGNVGGNLTGNVTGNVTASSGQSQFNDVVINGGLNMNAGSAATITNLTAPSSDLDAATKKYVDDEIVSLIDGAPAALNTLNEIAASLADDTDLSGTLTTSIAQKLPLGGGTMTGNITMSNSSKVTGLPTPSANTDAANKAYADTMLPLAGGTLSGALTLAGAPSSNLHAATKAYVDASAGSNQAAATSASQALGYRNEAEGFRNTAETHKNSAAASATAAANSFDSFDDVYLGAKSSAPSTDNDGDALQTGALYFDTTAGNMFVFDGSSFVVTGSAVNGTSSRQVYVATANQTTFAISHDVGFVDVYLNGLKLRTGTDFTDNNVSNIVLTSGANLNDVVDIVAYGAFQAANHYTQTQSDARYTRIANNLSELTGTASTARANIGASPTANPTFTGTVTIPTSGLNYSGTTVTATGAEINKLAGATASTAELNHVTGVTSAIQTQLNAKASTTDLATTNTAVGTKAPLASPNFTGTPQINSSNILTSATAPAGGNTVEMVASGTLANGDTVILNANGTVSSISGVTGGALSTQTFQSSNVYIGSKGTFHSGENKVLIVYRDSGNSSHGKIVAGTVSGNTLSFGTPETFHGQYTNDMDVAYDINANLVVVAYESTSSQYGEVRTYSLSGTSFTAQGSPTRWNSTNSSGSTRIQYDPDAQGCVLFYRDISGNNYGKARYVGVSGVVIAFGSPVTFESNLVTKIEVTYNTTENHHLAIYNRTSGGSTRQAYATVTLSGSTVSNQSSAVIFASDLIGDMDLAHDPTINKIALCCSGQSLNPISGYIVVGTPSTHSYTWTSAPSGSTRRFSGPNVIDMCKITYNPDTGKFIVMYRDLTDSYKGKGVEITIDASSNVTVGSTETFFDFNNAYYYAPIYDTNADKLVVGYHDQSDGNKGKAAIILFSSTTLTTSNFLGFSNAAYTNGQTATIQVTGNVDDAQTGLTINTTYFVQNDGTLGTSPSAIASVTAGKAIAATKILIA